MIIFNLPDLGEGLQDAQIRKWYVKVGDSVKVEQPLVAVETAKAIVDVPSPYAGTIVQLFGQAGDTIQTGLALVGFATEASMDVAATHVPERGTVVGEIQHSDLRIASINTETLSSHKIRITPKARLLAKKFGVNVAELAATGELITQARVKQALTEGHLTTIKPAQSNHTIVSRVPTRSPATSSFATLPVGPQSFSGMRHTMFNHMIQAQSVIAVCVNDYADIHQWYGPHDQDITVHLIRAMVAACQAEPLLNASLNSTDLSYQFNAEVNLGLAVDSVHGLYVPVIPQVDALSNQQLRQRIDQLKQQTQQKNLRPEQLHGATISLSNFGVIAGRYANAIIIPPQVAIIGVGKLEHSVVAIDNAIAIHPILPISLTFDHRLITGGEATRFLAVLIKQLQEIISEPKFRV